MLAILVEHCSLFPQKGGKKKKLYIVEKLSHHHFLRPLIWSEDINF